MVDWLDSVNVTQFDVTAWRDVAVTKQCTGTHPPPHHLTQTFNCQYLIHFSTDWAEILHDWFLGGKDPAYRLQIQNSDPAALQYPMQRHRILKHSVAYISTISQRIELKVSMIAL